MVEDTIDTTEEQERKDKKEATQINWNDIDQLEEPEGAEEYDIDPEGDAFTILAPPVPGIAPFLFTIGDAGIQLRTFKSRKNEQINYYSVPLVLTAKSENPLIDGAPIFVNLSTIFNAKKRTSSVLTVLAKLLGADGVKSAKTDLAQIKLLKKFIDQEPIREIRYEWECSYKAGVNVKTGRDEYKFIAKSFKDFPFDKSTKSGKKELFMITLGDKTQVEARPRLRVESWNPGSEKKATASAGNASTASSKTITAIPVGGKSELEKELD